VGYAVEANGRFDPATREAVRRLQRDRGLATDGIVGPATQAALKHPTAMAPSAQAIAELPANTVLRRGSAGEGVRRVQHRLNDYGAKLEVDGRYGPATAAAITSFQKTRGLTADGIAGPETLGSLTRSPTGPSAAGTFASARSRALPPAAHPAAPPPSAAARSQGPAPTAPAANSPFGTVVKDPLSIDRLAPVRGSVKGSAPMAIFDNPETIHTHGLIGSTIAPSQSGRAGSTQYEFPGQARLYSLVNNRTHDSQALGVLNPLARKNVHNSVVVYNPSDKPLTLSVSGVLYSKGITKPDGKIPHDYQRNGVFRGPHAIAASSYMAKEVDKNGYLSKSVTIPPRSAAVVAGALMAPGGEAFTLLDMKGDGRFRVAQAVTEKPLAAADLARIVDGSYPTAGSATRANSDHGDFIGAGPNKLGRPNGVTAGSVFRGGGSVDVIPGRTHGELLLSTRFKQAKGSTDLLPLAAVPGNKGAVEPAATFNDGGYGMSYDLKYQLRNRSNAPRRVQVVLTAPRLPTDGPFNPAGGMLTLPVRMDGVQRNARVSARATGVVLGTVEVPPRSTRDLSLQLTNLGNLFPPAGIELRSLP
jgi:peptidoglycan hydrolase-like protein with peptidoglycan-binding domain